MPEYYIFCPMMGNATINAENEEYAKKEYMSQRYPKSLLELGRIKQEDIIVELYDVARERWKKNAEAEKIIAKFRIKHSKEVHPVRFTWAEIGLITHMIYEVAGDYFEEESSQILEKIKLSEKDILPDH